MGSRGTTVRSDAYRRSMNSDKTREVSCYVMLYLEFFCALSKNIQSLFRLMYSEGRYSVLERVNK